MNSIVLKSMHLENFKGQKEFDITFGNKTLVKAMNGKGKTTIEDAYCWVMSNKMADGSAPTDIRPHDIAGNNIDMVEIQVKLEMEINGKPVEIIKVQKQRWVKHHGETEAVLEGNDNSYLVNTVPMKEKDFKAYISDIIPEDKFRSCTSATDFIKKGTKDRRKMLFDLIPIKSDAEIVAMYPQYAGMAADIENYSLEELKSKVNYELKGFGNNKGYKKELDEIPARIDALNRMKISVDVAQLELEKNLHIKNIEKLDAQIKDMSKTVDLTPYVAEISDLQGKIADIKTEQLNAKIEQQRILKDAVIEHMELNTKLVHAESDLNNAKTQRDIYDNKLTGLGIEYKNEKDKVFDDSKYVFDENSLICPCCNRPYEADKQGEIRVEFEKKKLADKSKFDNEKQAELKRLIDLGNEAKATVEKYELEIEKLEKEVAICKAEYQAKQNECQRLKDELDSTEINTDLTEITALNDKLLKVTEEYENARDNIPDTSELEKQKESAELALKEVEKQILAADTSKIDAEIASYIAKQRELAQFIANCEAKLDLYKEFEKTKIGLLTDEINKHFSVVKFVMYRKLVKGDGYEDACDIMVDGSIYGRGLNKANCTLADIDIIKGLQKLYDVSLPVFIDDSEKLDNTSLSKIKADCQQVYMRVTEDAEMKVEVLD